MSAKLHGKKVLMVIAPDQFRDEELLEPKKILEGEGAAVAVARTRAGLAQGMLGARISPELVLERVQASDFDGVVVVGGMGSPQHLWGDAKLHDLLRKTLESGKVVGGICLSGAVLARAGILRGKDATVYSTPESLAELSLGGAKYVEKPVVRAGNVVTASGPAAAAEFGRSLVDAMASAAAKTAPQAR